jgi:hypothetical protein
MPTSERLIQEPADESATSPLQDLTGVGCVSFLAGATKDQFAQRSVQSARLGSGSGSGPATWPISAQSHGHRAGPAGMKVPGPAARRAARRSLSIYDVANHFRCSTEMARWRLNMSGARRLQTA